MELATVPHRPPPGERRRLVLGLLVLTPVVLLVLLPAVLGLDRYVITDRSVGESLGRGSVVLDREVPASDLRVGDQITFRRPVGSSHQHVTREILAIRGTTAVTRGDGVARADRWRVDLDRSTYPRVILGVPYVGYPFLVRGGWLISFGVVAGCVLLLAWNVHRRRPQAAAVPSVGSRTLLRRTVNVG